MFNLFIGKIAESGPASFQGVGMLLVPIVEELLQANIFLYNIDCVVETVIGELAQRSVGNHFSTIRLLYYNSHICYVSNIDAVFGGYRYSLSDQCNTEAGNLEKPLTTCTERIKNVYLKNVYQLRETLFDKLGLFVDLYGDNQKLTNNSPIIDFKSICVEIENSMDTETSTRIGKRNPSLITISFILIQEPIFLCDHIPRDLVSSSNDASESMTTQSKTRTKMNSQPNEPGKESRFARILETLNQRRFHCCGIEAENDNSSTQFLHLQENQLIDLLEHFKRF